MILTNTVILVCLYLTKGDFMKNKKQLLNNEINKSDEIKTYVLRVRNSLYDNFATLAEKRGHSVNTTMILALNDWLNQQASKEI